MRLGGGKIETKRIRGKTVLINYQIMKLEIQIKVVVVVKPIPEEMQIKLVATVEIVPEEIQIKLEVVKLLSEMMLKIKGKTKCMIKTVW